MSRCSKCVLTDNFPGANIDDSGLCTYCRKSPGPLQREKREHDYRARFELLLSRSRPAGRYHAVMAYSGGKDSSYTLARLSRDYGLRMLAITFDNGFMSPQAMQNVGTVCRALNVDHVWLTPNEATLAKAFLRAQTESVFPASALQRASSICLTCIALIKSVVLRFAIDLEIPYLIYGWSPGQAPLSSSIMPINPAFFRKANAVTTTQLTQLMGPRADLYLLLERHFEALEKPSVGTDAPASYYLLHPLAFWSYSEEEIVSEIQRLGWNSPVDTDPNSSNCLLNSYNIQQHLRQHGFHPYAFELAGLVRLGFMSREEALDRLEKTGKPEVIHDIEKRLARYL